MKQNLDSKRKIKTVQKNEIETRLKKLKAELKKVELIAVSKYSEIEDVVRAYECGQLSFGENRVSDLEIKAEYFKNNNLKNVKWHFIGHLQSNKARDLLKIPGLYAVHSVDSLRLLEELLKKEHEFKGPELKIFFQINTSHENEKSGFESMDELKKAVQLLLTRTDSKLKIEGLMTMGAIRTEDVKASAIKSFRDLKAIREQLSTTFGLSHLKLSMGMSGDYKEALAEGADYIRIGSLIFK